MPRGRKEGKNVNATGVELKIVRLELSADQHKQLRVAAANREISMAALAREIMAEFLKKEGKR